MANSLIACKEESLWVGDSLLEIILFDFTKTIRDSLDNEKEEHLDREWFEKYYEDLMYYLKGFSIGGIDFQLDNIVEYEYRVTKFKRLLKKVRKSFLLRGNEISKEDLNLIENMKLGEKVYWEEPIKTKEVIDIIDKIIMMIDPLGRSFKK